jgi:diguanylate cyclase (GGDEF)-like protein
MTDMATKPDECLSSFADAIRANATDKMLFSRIGGDEFSFAFLQTDVQETLAQIARIRTYLKLNPIKIKNRTEVLNFACGIASYPEDGGDLSELFKLSDRRMYEEKAHMKTGNPDQS